MLKIRTYVLKIEVGATDKDSRPGHAMPYEVRVALFHSAAGR
jgi:hypothetical protein